MGLKEFGESLAAYYGNPIIDGETLLFFNDIYNLMMAESYKSGNEVYDNLINLFGRFHKT